MNKGMKSLKAAVLTATLVLSMGATAFAAEESTQDVKAKYVKSAAADIVYSVDISFGSMEFTYTPESEGTWDAEKHEFVNKKAAAWNYNGQNTVKVTNHSNSAISVALDFKATEDYKDITGDFADNKLMELATAVGTTVDAAPTKTAALTLKGALPATAEENVTIGTVTVTIQK